MAVLGMDSVLQYQKTMVDCKNLMKHLFIPFS